MYTQQTEETDLLLGRIVAGEADSGEIEEFALWIKDPENERYFEQFKEFWHIGHDLQPGEERTQEALNGYLKYIRQRRKKEKRRKRFYSTISYAAIALLLVGLYISIRGYYSNMDYSNISLADLKYNTDSIKVHLSDGRVINPLNKSFGTIADSDVSEIRRDSSNSRLISYVPKKANKVSKRGESEPVQYNSVTIPPGERFVIMLSDGTVVHLNSNSYIRYPVNFGSDSRNVTLSGRAYFDVSKSDVPFIVTTKEMEVEVLGTSFDVESTGTGKSSSVILVEGSVKVSANGQTKIINPNEKFTLNSMFNEFTVSNIDSRTMTLWKDGILVLKELSFDQMIESLCSWYGVEIVDHSTVPDSDRFNGRFDREDIRAAMKTISLSAKVGYKIKDGKLLIEDAN